MAQLDINVKGVNQASKRMDLMGRRATRARDAFDQILDILVEANSKRWGKGWKPLAESTLEGKAQKGQGRTPLVASGALKLSLTRPGAPHQIREVSNQEARYGTDLFYARFADKGRGDNQPARKLIRVTPTTRKNIRQVVLDHLTGR